MVRNLAIDHLRKSGRASSVNPHEMPREAFPVAPRAASLLEQVDSGSSLRALIDSLPEAQRRVVALRFVFELNPTEIADVVGSTPGAVRHMQHRALKALAGEVAPPRHGP